VNDEKYAVSVSELEEIITIAADNPPIIVDLDETIFLRNSTEEYLNTLQPRVLGWLLLAFLNFIKPWNFLPGKIKGEVSRDWVRVVVATLIFPWTLILWQWRAKKLAKRYANHTLIQAINQNKNLRLILATNGFDFIVNSLSKHLPIAFNDVIACRFWQGATDRQRGKESLVTASLGRAEVARAIVVTDSIHDSPLLALVGKPCLVIWPEAKYIPAMSDVYIPFLYLERAKRPNKKYFLKVILNDDFLVLILALSWISSHPVLHGMSMFFLMLSFWCIYELGYVENDIIATKFEKSPQLSETYQRYVNRINVRAAWLWAVFFAIPGLIILTLSKTSFNLTNFIDTVRGIDVNTLLVNMAWWIGFLVVVRGTFWIYNYVDKQTRTWLYFILQVFKSFGFLVVTPTNAIGVALFAAKAICAWIPYFIYRFTKTAWSEDLPIEVLRTFLFGFLTIAIALGTQNVSIIVSWQALAILLFCSYRARRQFGKIVRQVYPIAQDQWDTNK
jgi:hypothetical protein